jgi:hypothetical protein
MRYVPFCTLYFNEPWTLPSPTMSYEGHSHIGIKNPLSLIEVSYRAIINATTDLDPLSSQKDEEDPILEPVC